jgi:hypothetical protein
LKYVVPFLVHKNGYGLHLIDHSAPTMKKYTPPQFRKKEEVPLDLSAKSFPQLGAVRSTFQTPETSLATLAKTWSTKEEEAPIVVVVKDRSLEESREALRAFYRQPKPPKFEYVYNDDKHDARLAELEYAEALEYAERDEALEYVKNDPWALKSEEEWSTIERVVKTSHHTFVPIREMTDAEIYERVNVITKKLHRNDTLNEEREKYDAELRVLEKLLSSE